VLELDLAAIEPPAAAPPAGVEITSWAERPELAEGLYEVAREAWLDIPGNDADRIEPFEEWLHVHMGGDGDLPEATFVALVDGEVVGYAKFSIPSAQRGVAWHDLTGVKRAWRGRGIARALKSAQIAWAKREGYELLRTHNEERNAPIQRLNAAFGYRPAATRVRLRRPLVEA
jgi:GNAT superfamily N-acetyltransferase